MQTEQEFLLSAKYSNKFTVLSILHTDKRKWNIDTLWILLTFVPTIFYRTNNSHLFRVTHIYIIFIRRCY